MYIRTKASELSNEEIQSFIMEYFENVDKFKGKSEIVTSMRELLYEAKCRKLYTDAEIRAMGAEVGLYNWNNRFVGKSRLNLMYENGLFMFSNEDLELVYRRKKFKIYGETLGATHDVISLLYALEKNYNSILAYEKVLINEGYRFKLHGNCNTDDLKRFYFDLKKKQNNTNIG